MDCYLQNYGIACSPHTCQSLAARPWLGPGLESRCESRWMVAPESSALGPKGVHHRHSAQRVLTNTTSFPLSWGEPIGDVIQEGWASITSGLGPWSFSQHLCGERRASCSQEEVVAGLGSASVKLYTAVPWTVARRPLCHLVMKLASCPSFFLE